MIRILQTSMLRRLPLLLAACFLSGCGGSSSGSSDDPELAQASMMKSAAPATIAYSQLPDGSFALHLKNASDGRLPDDQIYVEIVSQPDGKVTAVDATSTNVPDGPEGDGTLGAVGTLTSGDDLAAHAFTLAQLTNHTLYLPGDARYLGTRIYVSVRRRLQMPVNAVADGYTQPNIENPSDPNYATPFDWFEMTYAPQGHPKVAFGGNITQVDGFSIPMSFEVKGVGNTDIKRGITLGVGSSSGVDTRDQLMNKYLDQPGLDEPFRTLVQKDRDDEVIRLVAPYHGAAFKPGGAAQRYFDGYVDHVWRYYSIHELDFNDQADGTGNRYRGRVVPGANGERVFRVSRNDGPTFDIAKPGTDDVFTNNGTLQPGGTDANAFGALLAAAINRHVATRARNWLDPSSFYRASPSNQWAHFWHQVSIDGLAYGMGFDDTADQSSVAILPADENLKSLTISIGW
ncbi:beta-1,3-glucanase family protein [Burkholderia dolosa]|nr:beta-1,3-glucanase family protein [Burkholderia dolosa]AYZ94522.1 hypothetical protein EGY28_05305 [Burkholderia dolosa]PRE56627.1 hypothetical protein C6P87_02455 [Burkholderia sp. AU12872]PUA76555.1 hypothetical protein DB771_12055 [Burkholderia sp. AU29985]